MKAKIVFLILLVAGFLFQNTANGQNMYVKTGTYVFAKNAFVYIKQDLELNAATSNFYLRQDGQLIQATTGFGANKGVGNLSVFQEGTVNNYQYNYWCSPVGNTNSSTSTNNPFGIIQLKDISDLTTSVDPTILGTGVYDGTANPFAIASYWIWKLIPTISSDWAFVGSDYTLNPGEGFTMKGTSGTNTTTVNGVQNNPGSNQRYDFRGKPNDGTIDIPVVIGKYTLTGNPYPSAMDLKLFLQEALNCTGIAYFWEHDKTINSHYLADYQGGYGTYSPGADVYSPAVFHTYDGAGNVISDIASPGIIYKRRYSPIGQGFIIEGSADGNVQMKNSYRVFVKEGIANNSEFEKRANTNKSTGSSSTELCPHIRFNTLLNNLAISQMVLAFDPLSTDGVDRAMDAASPNNGPANNYFVINNKEYVIEVVPFDIDKKIAIGFRNLAETNYKITVNEMVNISEIQNVYIHDKTAGIYFDIKNGVYDVTLPAGTNNTQYEITFKNEVLGVDELVRQDFIVYQNNTTKNFTISNPLQKEITFCGLYDMAGKLIFSKKKLGIDTLYEFSTANLVDGIYIVKLATNDKVESGIKIIVINKKESTDISNKIPKELPKSKP